jgi:hypothetical protein
MSQKRWTKKEARKVMRQWRRSGLSLGEFARKQGWDEQRLRYWAARDEVGVEREAKGEPGTRFVPGIVVDVGAHERVSVALPRGVVVEARRLEDVAPTWVAEVVRALEAAR